MNNGWFSETSPHINIFIKNPPILVRHYFIKICISFPINDLFFADIFKDLLYFSNVMFSYPDEFRGSQVNRS